MKPAKTTGLRQPAETGDATGHPQKNAGQNPDETSFEIPSILLEGDEPFAPDSGGPGQRYALGPTAPAESFETADLPESYGTRRLTLTARDPHWLYAHWDLAHEEQKRFNALSSHGHLILRIYADAIAGRPETQVHVHPESRNWFVHVGRGGTRYLAELGYHQHDGHWATIATSSPTLTPPDYIAAGGAIEFATIPVDVPFQRLAQIASTPAGETGSLADAIELLRMGGHSELPGAAPYAGATWTPEQQAALAAVLNMDEVRYARIGSLELAEFVRRLMPGEQVSAAPGIGSPAGGFGGVSSPFGGEARRKDFWFNINAELIVYGASEPDATVTIGGRAIPLRPDGSFSCRFALPDGKYELPVVAVAADQTDARAAELYFSRGTVNRGDVGTHLQNPALKPPTPENL